MITAIPINEIESLVIKQLNTLFVTNEDDNALIINEINRRGGGG